MITNYFDLEFNKARRSNTTFAFYNSRIQVFIQNGDIGEEKI